MNTFQLECFLAVAENLSFARAAQQLHITQPAVTQQIKALEKELNAKLFARSTRSVKLTREGAVFLYDSRHILSIARRMTDRFAAAESDAIGDIFAVDIQNKAPHDALQQKAHLGGDDTLLVQDLPLGDGAQLRKPRKFPGQRPVGDLQTLLIEI